MIPRNEPIPALLKLIADWVPHLHAKHRMNATDIPPFVPPPLRAIYELAGNYPVPFNEQWRRPNWIAGLFSSQDQLLPPDQLKNGIYVFGEPTHSFYLHNSKLFVMETGGYWLATNDETELKHISDRHQIRRIH